MGELGFEVFDPRAVHDAVHSAHEVNVLEDHENEGGHEDSIEYFELTIDRKFI